MKKIFIYVTLFCLIAELSIIPGIFFEYLANQRYYSEVLCLNKDNKELACNGKCILMQKLDLASKKKDARSQSQLEDILDLFNSLFIAQQEGLSEKININQEEKSSNSNSGLRFSAKHINGLLDPPKL